MIYMLDTSQDYDLCASELGVATEYVCQLITPLTRYSNRNRASFAIDNGAFAGFNQTAFKSLLEREWPNRGKCKFVVAPDVPCDARRTLEVFDRWVGRLSGWPIALAVQNGQESLPIPWDAVDAIFVGGDDAWKMSCHAMATIRAAKALGKWTHMGRVNSPKRVATCKEWGVDSVDGTGISRYSHMRNAIREASNSTNGVLELTVGDIHDDSI